MNATIPNGYALESSDEPTVAADQFDAELREAAIASLKRKRKFGQDVVGYITVNGVFWLIWALTDRSADGPRLHADRAQQTSARRVSTHPGSQASEQELLSA